MALGRDRAPAPKVAAEMFTMPSLAGGGKLPFSKAWSARGMAVLSFGKPGECYIRVGRYIITQKQSPRRYEGGLYRIAQAILWLFYLHHLSATRFFWTSRIEMRRMN